MKLVIFGSTGGTGRTLLQQALDQGHHVVAFARNPTKLEEIKQANLQVVRGDVLDSAAVEKAVADQDAVFCSIGTGAERSTLREDGTRNIVEAMAKTGVKRLICLHHGRRFGTTSWNTSGRVPILRRSRRPGGRPLGKMKSNRSRSMTHLRSPCLTSSLTKHRGGEPYPPRPNHHLQNRRASSLRSMYSEVAVGGFPNVPFEPKRSLTALCRRSGPRSRSGPEP
jgi:hypothetical protein